MIAVPADQAVLLITVGRLAVTSFVVVHFALATVAGAVVAAV